MRISSLNIYFGIAHEQNEKVLHVGILIPSFFLRFRQIMKRIKEISLLVGALHKLMYKYCLKQITPSLCCSQKHNKPHYSLLSAELSLYAVLI